ncbi:hypothetical protein FPQ18DRAFT_311272 [Pyronema domesticum]|nr:hypothetical protein FPQ18DRAFT_311272 [Pyronema domesticum]
MARQDTTGISIFDTSTTAQFRGHSTAQSTVETASIRSVRSILSVSTIREPVRHAFEFVLWNMRVYKNGHVWPSAVSLSSEATGRTKWTYVTAISKISDLAVFELLLVSDIYSPEHHLSVETENSAEESETNADFNIVLDGLDFGSCRDSYSDDGQLQGMVLLDQSLEDSSGMRNPLHYVSNRPTKTITGDSEASAENGIVLDNLDYGARRNSNNDNGKLEDVAFFSSRLRRLRLYISPIGGSLHKLCQIFGFRKTSSIPAEQLVVKALSDNPASDIAGRNAPRVPNAVLWETAREMAKSGLNKSEKLMLDSGRFSDSIKSVTEDAKLAKYGRDQKRIGKKAIKDRYANVVDIAAYLNHQNNPRALEGALKKISWTMIRQKFLFPIKAVNYFSQNTSYPFEFDTYATKFQRYIDEIDNSEKGSRTLADMVIETV